MQRELHRREIRSNATGNFMQNDNTHGRPVGTVSYNEVTEGTTMDDANDAHFLLSIQGVPGGKDLTSGECSLGQTIPI